MIGAIFLFRIFQGDILGHEFIDVRFSRGGKTEEDIFHVFSLHQFPKFLVI